MNDNNPKGHATAILLLYQSEVIVCCPSERLITSEEAVNLCANREFINHRQ